MGRVNPETKIRNALIDFLELRGWHVEIFHGSMFQKGIPDLFLWHPTHGFRWVDVKVPVKNSLTKAQQKKWPEWERWGLGIWILVAATVEEYKKLFRPANWRKFWRRAYGKKEADMKQVWGELVDEHRRTG